ncbi:hypothetical protein GCM10027076_24890 [Nocardioides montaniterrae]
MAAGEVGEADAVRPGAASATAVTNVARAAKKARRRERWCMQSSSRAQAGSRDPQRFERTVDPHGPLGEVKRKKRRGRGRQPPSPPASQGLPLDYFQAFT